MFSGDNEQENVKCYEPLVAQIKAGIEDGRYQAGQKIGTESGFVRQTGLSRNSVRRGVDRLVEEGLVERRPGKGIFAASERARERSIQVVVPQFADSFHRDIAQGAQDACRKHGLFMQVQDAHGKVQDDLELIRRLPEISGDGAVIVAEHHPDLLTVLFDLLRKEYPFVLVDKKLHELPAPSVFADNYRGGYLVGQKLLELGHNNIAMVVDPQASTAHARKNGFRDALNDAGVAVGRSMLVDCHAGSGYSHSAKELLRLMTDATRQVLALKPRPTAIFFWNDEAAAYGCRALHELGLRVPDDISVMGFDDTDICELLNPPLSSVHQPIRQMGEVAVNLLLEWIERGQKPWEGKDRILPVELKMRASVASVPRQ